MTRLSQILRVKMSKLLNATYADLIDVVTTSISHKFGIEKNMTKQKYKKGHCLSEAKILHKNPSSKMEKKKFKGN